ncbi:YceI family protein [Mucilaginibacter sp. HMF5004]|uniref:YceI family protein n=1 Tax=Mucilaginibacter rivuli TaxID=2857527 RepID=UPI001C5FB679|nr:YceI family protein [Mucilaginibacter rivuli]MBW4891017.1 YceI family protein [Mucilaginibacter rivuli]
MLKKQRWACLLLGFTAFMLLGFTAGMIEPKKWLISESSNLCVNGNTNVNKFSCEIPACDRTDTLNMTRNKSSKEITLSGNISLSIQSFDCHNAIMTRDLRTTLKEKQYPRLRILFLSLSNFPELTEKPQLITGLVNIEMVGITKRFEVNYQVSIDDQKVVHLLGTRDINFSDFDLTPPRKLGGLIKTNNKLSVIFHLKIKELN